MGDNSYSIPAPVTGLMKRKPNQECEGHRNNNDKRRKIPVVTGRILMEPIPLNPLMLGHIVENVFQHLQNEADLSSCFNVCQLWRKRVGPYYEKIAEPTKLTAELADKDSQAYLTELRHFPDFLKRSKFYFHWTRLNSPRMQFILARNGSNIKSLTLDYIPSEKNAFYPSAEIREQDIISVEDFANLLLNQLPNLKILKINFLPVHITNSSIISAAAAGGNSTKLKLKEIIFADCETNRDFAKSLFSISPDLLKFDLAGNYNSVLCTLDELSQINQIKKLVLSNCDNFLLRFLNLKLTFAQLEEFKSQFMFNINQEELEEFLNKQGPTLLELKLQFCSESFGIDCQLNSMPNLKDLELITSVLPRKFQSMSSMDNLIKINFGGFQSGFKFPILETLRLRGDTRRIVMDSLFSQEEHIEPVNSLRVIYELPIGIDQLLMGRIGKLFPNLKILMTLVPYEFQNMLIGVWENCTNLEDVVLNLGDGDSSRSTDVPGIDIGCGNVNPVSTSTNIYKSLDCIFSGIPELYFESLKELSEEELQRTDYASLRLNPSICDLRNLLTNLRHLYIFGPGYTIFGSRQRNDKFTNVFGYSTLCCLSPTINYAQILNGLSHITPKCTEFIKRNLSLSKPDSGFNSGIDFIKNGCGYEYLKEIPFVYWA